MKNEVMQQIFLSYSARLQENLQLIRETLFPGIEINHDTLKGKQFNACIQQIERNR